MRNPWPGLTVREVVDLLVRRYELERRPSAAVARYQAVPLLRELGDLHPCEVDTERLDAYAAGRLAEDASRSTVNKELGLLRRACRLASETRRRHPAGIQLALLGPHEVPPVRSLPHADRPRRGFLSPADFERLLSELKGDIRDVVEFLGLTGWRRGEVLGLLWREVDLADRLVRLSPERSKNRHGRLLPLSDRLSSLLLRRAGLAEKRGTRGADGRVFTRGENGKPIRSFSRAWRSACQRAGLPDLIPHDLRRSYARWLIRSGVDRDTAMALTGHRTDSMFRRYNIQALEDLRDASRRVTRLFDAE